MTIRERLGTPPKTTARERNQARANGTLVDPPKKITAPPGPDVQCVHRSWTSVGKIKCGCAHRPEVFTCDCKFILSGYATPRLSDKPGDGPIVMADGSLAVPADDRYPTFLPMPLHDDERPRPCDVVVCASCPYRVEPPPHILRLRQLGIQGDYDPDTGHADIIHALTKAAAWSGHSADWVASGPDGMRSVSVAGDKATDLGQIIEATGCRLLVCHSTWCEPKTIEAAAVAFPAVRFWGVLHGSQNSMVLASDWARRQSAMLDLSRRLPNVWYGTPEPTVPLASFGFERYQQWKNTLAVDIPTDPPPVVDPVTILIAGRDENIKGLPAAVLAAGIVNRQRPVKVVACVKGSVGPLAALAATVGVPFESRGFLPLPAFRAFVRQSVSIMVNPSLSDAWQYTGLDALSQGRPVVGSQTIRYLPREWQADPNDPADIARVACMFLDDYDRYSAEALKLGCEIRDRQREAYHVAIARILG